MSLVYQEFRHRGHLPLGALQPREHRGPVKVSHCREISIRAAKGKWGTGFGK